MLPQNPARFLDRSTPPNIFTLVLLAGTGALSMNVFLPALPEMAEYFGTPYSVSQLAVPLYLVMNAVLQVIVGPLADKFGRRPVTLAGLIFFVIASIGCIYAPTAGLFLFFRMLQSTIAIGFVLSRAVVRDMYPADKAAAMIGYVAMGMSLVPMFSPVIGGWMTEQFGWQSTFWLMVGMGVVACALSWADQGETSPPRPITILAQFRQYPELLRAPRFWGYSLAVTFSSGAFFAYLGGAPFVGSEIFGLTPQALGYWFGAPAIGYLLGNFTTSQVAERLGINRMILIGSIVAVTGPLAALIAFELGLRTELVFFGSMTFVGFGNGMVIPNGTSGALSVRPHLAGTASGFSGALMIGGGAALAALAGAMLTPERGAFPLLALMSVVCAAGVLMILLVIRRERKRDCLSAFAKAPSRRTQSCKGESWPSRNSMPARNCARSARGWR